MEYGKYTFRLRLNDNAVLPYYKGSTFRGLLGHALKRTVCALKQKECRDCVLRSSCVYALAFETTVTLPAVNGSRISAPPHPMVLEPPLTSRQSFSAGDILECGLILFGVVNRNLPYFIYAFDQMGRMGLGKKIQGKRTAFDLESVLFQDRPVYEKQKAHIHPPEALPSLGLTPVNGDGPKRIRVRMETPLRIPGGQALQPNLSFPVLVRALIRRNTALLNTWGRGEPDLDYSGLARLAQEVQVTGGRLTWLDWQRYSARQDRKMFMGGLIGEIEYQGDLAPYMPFLKMAEIVHAGKNTAFGLGKINIKASSR